MKTEWVVGGVVAVLLAGGGVWYWQSQEAKKAAEAKAAAEKAEAERRAAEERARQERELAAARSGSQGATRQAPAAQPDFFTGVLNAVGPIAQGVTGLLGGAKSVLGAFGVKL